jgi:nucleoside-diphosphate-sugar epimerase
MKNGVRWCRGDVGAPEAYRGTLAEFQPEAALHLAWEGIPDFSLQKCMANLHSGVLFGNAVLEAGCRHLVVAGSCWEDGKVDGMVSEDAPAALVMLLETTAAGVFNVGSGTLTRPDEVAGLLLRIAGKEDLFAAQRAEDGPGARSGFYADVSRMRALGWSPRVGLEEGLRRTFEGIASGARA